MSKYFLGERFSRKDFVMIKEWTEQEVEQLKNKFNNTPIEELAREFGRSAPSVICKAYRLGITTQKYSGWSPEEIEKLKQQFPIKTTKLLANELGRSINSVRQKAFRLRIKKKYEYLKSIGLAQ